MIELSIDGQKVKVGESSTILEAAQELDISIPTLCHSKFLSPYGACRVCLVEVSRAGRTELMTSCNNTVQKGMSVKTNTDRVLNARRIVVELLLSRCPDSEQILILAEQLGIKQTRFGRREKECILCGLCVRMCEERMGKSAISFANRGIAREIVPPFSEKTQICQTCGACVSVCPTDCMDLSETTVNKPKPLGSEFNSNLSSRSPIFIPFPQAVPNWPVIDKGHCVHLLNGTCGICEQVCEAEAIDYEQNDEKLDIDVGAVVVVPGFEEFLGQLKYDFGYSRYPDVVSSIQFERILSASGPFAGHVQRPSDGKEPKKIAFLQCVGSRDISCRNAYCSSVCCMYAIKEAVIAKEHLKDVDVTVFFMDMRAFG
ncbi:MAG: 2Fe-2S iron-sulfur cluster-binding protein, partial [Planctomycetota bacterium]